MSSRRPLIFLDTETTSLAFDRQPWEIALIRVDDDGEKTRRFFLEIDETTADPVALSIGGYYTRHPLGRWHSGTGDLGKHDATVEDPKAAAREIAQLTHGATIIGACPWFDTHVLERLLLRYGFLPQWHYRLIDVEALTAGYFGCKIGGLSACAEALGVARTDLPEHEAWADAALAQRIWNSLKLQGF